MIVTIVIGLGLALLGYLKGIEQTEALFEKALPVSIYEETISEVRATRKQRYHDAVDYLFKMSPKERKTLTLKQDIEELKEELKELEKEAPTSNE